MIPISVRFAQRAMYGGEITFPDKQDIRKFLKQHGWTKLIKYSRKWFKEGLGEWDLHMAHNLELYPERLNKIQTSPFSFLTGCATRRFLENTPKPGQTFSVSLDGRFKS